MSLLSNTDKVFERIMYNRLYNFLAMNGIIYNLQSGFKQKYSTSHALIHLTDICVCVCIYINEHTSMYIYMNVYIYVHTYYIYIYNIYIYMCVCVCVVCMYICIWIYICVYIYMHISLAKFNVSLMNPLFKLMDHFMEAP